MKIWYEQQCGLHASAPCVIICLYLIGTANEQGNLESIVRPFVTIEILWSSLFYFDFEQCFMKIFWSNKNISITA